MYIVNAYCQQCTVYAYICHSNVQCEHTYVTLFIHVLTMYCTLSGTGPLPMESSTPPSETTQDDVPGTSGEWLID